MKKHSTANILLMELLVVILFFMLCVATLVEVLGLARSKSAFASAENAAMLRIENLEGLLQTAASPEEELARNGFEAEDGAWVLREETYTLRAGMAEEKTGAGSLRTVTFTAEKPNGDALFELPTVKYIPGEVGP